jgi:regulator of sirC expression with transglutaminase-like and TPR domain
MDRIPNMVDELEAAVRLDPRHAYAHYHLGLAYNKQDKTDRAILHLERFLDLAPDAPEAPQVRALLSRLRM